MELVDAFTISGAQKLNTTSEVEDVSIVHFSFPFIVLVLVTVSH